MEAAASPHRQTLRWRWPTLTRSPCHHHPQHACSSSLSEKLSNNINVDDPLIPSTSSSTPFASAPSSPIRQSSDVWPTETIDGAATGPFNYEAHECITPSPSSLPSDFDFSARFLAAPLSPAAAAPPTMSTAEELFSNGKIKPLNSELYKILEQSSYNWSCNNLQDVNDTIIAENSTYAPGGNEDHHLRVISKQSSIADVMGPGLSALEQWKRKHLDKAESRHAKEHTYVEGSHGHPHRDVDLKHAHAHGSRRHHRRARSLSPLRVFHMDDMVHRRPSFKGEMYTAFMQPHGIILQSQHHDVAMDIRRRSTFIRSRRKSWTLKDLLNLGDNRVHDRGVGRFSSKIGGSNVEEPSKVREKLGGGDISRNTACLQGNSTKVGSTSTDNLEGDKLHLAGDIEGSNRSLVDYGHGNMTRLRGLQQQGMLGQADHYYFGSQRAKLAETMKKRTLLPYKTGLLGCLGFPNSRLKPMKESLHAMYPNPM